MNWKYYLGALISIPLLPLMYYQGKKIRERIPRLPEATGRSGITSGGAQNGRTIQLITLGESTIAGVGVKTHEEGFSGTLAKELSSLIQVNINWCVYAKSGYTAKKITERMIPKIKEEDLDLIVVGLGGNDAFTLNTPGRWRKDVIELIHELRRRFPRAIITFCNMPPIKEFPAFTSLIKFTVGNLVELFGRDLSQIVKAHENVYYFGDVITLDEWIEKLQIDAKRSEFFSDGVHPSKLTYQTWARDIATRMSIEKEIVDNLIANN